jgi:DNA polymerase-1
MIYYITNQIELPNSNYSIGTKDMVLDLLTNTLLIGLDTETTGLDPHTAEIRIITLGSVDDCFVIDIRSVGVSWLVETMNKSNSLFIAFNMKFDYKMLKSVGINLKNTYCCMIAEQVLTMGLRLKHSLSSTLSRYFGETLDKEIRLEFLNPDLQIKTIHILYAARDVSTLFRLYRSQIHNILNYKLLNVVKLECRVLNAIADMEYIGITIDLKHWNTAIIKDLEFKIKFAKNLLNTFIANEVYGKIKSSFIYEKVTLDMFDSTYKYKFTLNWRSTKQKIKFLKELGYNLEVFDMKKQRIVEKVDKITLANNASSDYLTLKKVKDKMEYLSTTKNICDILLFYTEVVNLLSKYGTKFLNLINTNTNRLHTDFMQLGTVTGRVSSTKPNLQNIPKSNVYRMGFIAKKGCKIITIDYSNAELRIMAEGSQEESFLTSITNKEDLHSKLAMLMPANKGLVISQTQNAHLRQKQKTATFGIAYGAGKAKFGEEFMNDFRIAAPSLFKWLDLQSLLAVKNGYTLTFSPINRIVWLAYHKEVVEILNNKRKYKKHEVDWAKKLKASFERNGKNYPIQGTSADITKMAILLISNWIKITNQEHLISLVNQVHDEILIEVEESIATQIAKDIAVLMEIVGCYSIKSVRMEVDYHINDYWEK